MHRMPRMSRLKSVLIPVQQFFGILLPLASNPWFLAAITIFLFCGVQSESTLDYETTEPDMVLQEKMMMVQRKSGLVDMDSVQRLDDLLQKNGWVDEIIR